jgi:putative transposase
MRTVEGELDQAGSRMPNLWSLVKDPEEFWGDLGRHGRRLLRELLEGTMELWRDEWIKADWHQACPDRQGLRNGYYRRKRWVTALGPLENVRVPRCRQAGLTGQMFERLENHREALGDSAVNMLLAGVSTRRVGDLLERIIELPISPGQVSRLAKRLDADVRAYHTRKIPDRYVYLLLDAIHLKARGLPRLFQTGLRRTRQRVVLVAYGIRDDGIKEIIDFRLAAGETRAAWEQFLMHLYRRGLQGEPLRLIATDGGGGVIAGVEAAYPHVRRQRCWFHKMQNVSAKVKRRDRTRVVMGLRKVYAAPTRRAAVRAYQAWARQWLGPYEAAVRCVDRDLEELLAVYDLPVDHRRMMRTTNGIERCFREVRRRTRSIGTFVNDASIERIIYGLVAYHNAKYATRVCSAFRKVRHVA